MWFHGMNETRKNEIKQRMRREKKKTTTKNRTKTNTTHNAYFLCWRKMKMAFDSTWLAKESSWVKSTFCRWRILSRFLHCLWTFYTVFICLFVGLLVCTFASSVACKTKCWLFLSNLSFISRSRLNLLFAWIFDWTNLSFGFLALFYSLNNLCIVVYVYVSWITISFHASISSRYILFLNRFFSSTIPFLPFDIRFPCVYSILSVECDTQQHMMFHYFMVDFE